VSDAGVGVILFFVVVVWMSLRGRWMGFLMTVEARVCCVCVLLWGVGSGDKMVPAL
jgi:hypothetical protein